MKQFGFLKGCFIHEDVGLAQESLHAIRQKKLPAIVMKLGLSKAYDRCFQLYLNTFDPCQLGMVPTLK